MKYEYVKADKKCIKGRAGGVFLLIRKNFNLEITEISKRNLRLFLLFKFKTGSLI